MEEGAPGKHRGFGIPWLASELAGQAPRPQRTIALAGGLLYGAGASIVLVGLFVDRSPGTRFVIALPAVGVAYVAALLLLVFP